VPGKLKPFALPTLFAHRPIPTPSRPPRKRPAEAVLTEHPATNDHSYNMSACTCKFLFSNRKDISCLSFDCYSMLMVSLF
jgi:hypothetical protein